jgi:hypothetical protein
MSDTPNRPVDSAGKLPARANLEHLKNEAKQLLKTMRVPSLDLRSNVRSVVRSKVRLPMRNSGSRAVTVFPAGAT